jgi:hypothetical protein
MSVPVYFLGEDEKGCSHIKIGVAKNIEARKRNLQTGNPLELRLLGWIETADEFGLEARLKNELKAVRSRGEWFDIEPADILPFLVRAGRDGFVAKNADAFQITGYDSDAISEYLGVWEWADLDISVAPFAVACAVCISRRRRRCTTVSDATRSPIFRSSIATARNRTAEKASRPL